MFKARQQNQSQQTLDLRKVSDNSAKTRRPRLRPWVVGLLAGLVLVAAVGGIFAAYRAAHPSTSKSAMLQAVARVSKLMFLPAGETPTYGTVADASKLKGETFFINAKNGDEILIYQKAKLTILYRPSINKIVNVGPLIVGSSGSPYLTSRIAIKNGTSNQDFADSLAVKLKQLYPNASLVSSEPASRPYSTSIAIDLTKKNQPLDEQVADSLGIQAGKPPLGEAMPDGDILIIIGADYK